MRVEVLEQRIRDCDFDARAVTVERERTEASRVFLFGQELDDLGVDLGAAEVDDREAELLGEHVGERAFAEQVELDEEVAESLARRRSA